MPYYSVINYIIITSCNRKFLQLPITLIHIKFNYNYNFQLHDVKNFLSRFGSTTEREEINLHPYLKVEEPAVPSVDNIGGLIRPLDMYNVNLKIYFKLF